MRLALAGTAIAIVTALVDALVLNRRQWRYFTATTTPEGLQLHTGRIICTDATIRRDAVLSVEVATGPLLRRLGLARLKVNGIVRLPELPAMALADVQALRADLTCARPVLDDSSVGAS